MTFYRDAGHKRTCVLYVKFGWRTCQQLQTWRQGELLSLCQENLTLTEDVLNTLRSKRNLRSKDSVRISQRPWCTFH